MRPVETSLHDFLEQLDGQLNGLPPRRRLEVVDETREHLEAMIAARRADGLSENEAWQSARAAFGEADGIGLEISQEWQRAPRFETLGRPLSRPQKAAIGARPFLATFLASQLLLSLVARLAEHHLAGLFLVFATSALYFGLNLQRKTPLSLSASLSMVMLWLISSILAFKSVLRDLGVGASAARLAAASSVVVIGIGALAWRNAQRGSLARRPASSWRHSERYWDNPIAAEEEYRLGPFAISSALWGASAGSFVDLWELPNSQQIWLGTFSCGCLIALNWTRWRKREAS